MAISMGNAVKSLKTHLARMSEEPALSEEESRRKTLTHLEYFEQEKLLKAGASIAEHGAGEIRTGDVVVAHGASHHAREILRRARRAGVAFASSSSTRASTRRRAKPYARSSARTSRARTRPSRV